MKILYVVHEFFPQHYTGTARFGLNLATQMQKMGNTIKILTYGETETENLTPFGKINYKKYLFNNLEIWSFRHVDIVPRVHFDIFDPEIQEDIYQLIEQEKLNDVDVVHIIHPLRTGIIAQYFYSKKIPLILTLTDYWTICPRVQLLKIDDSICNGPLVSKCANECEYPSDSIKERMKFSKILMNYAKMITVPSSMVKQIFTMNGSSMDKFYVINHGLNYQNFQIKPRKKLIKNDPIVFGYVGPILMPKGIELLINAFMKVPNKKLSLKIYGSCLNQNEYFMHLKKIAGLDPRIEFMGEYRYENLPEILSGIDVEIFSSIWYETYCLALLEGLAHNVPIIASDTIGSAVEFIDNNKSGLLFKSKDIEQLINLIKQISEDPQKLNEIAKQIIYPPRIEEEAITYEQLYRKAIR
jgi:glycosyltransferase involved in cell wall biosynthesis